MRPAQPLPPVFLSLGAAEARRAPSLLPPLIAPRPPPATLPAPHTLMHLPLAPSPITGHPITPLALRSVPSHPSGPPEPPHATAAPQDAEHLALLSSRAEGRFQLSDPTYRVVDAGETFAPAKAAGKP